MNKGRALSQELDLTGLRCPVPIVRLMKAVVQLEPGDEIRASANDPAFEADVAAWCRKTGHLLIDIEHGDALKTAVIRKSDSK